jgi:hypothetical protein
MLDSIQSRNDFYPEYIYYCSSEEVSNVSDLSPENRFVVDRCSSAIQESSRNHSQELAKLRVLVERPCDHDALKQEVAELTGLVKELMLQLRTNNTPSQLQATTGTFDSSS